MSTLPSRNDPRTDGRARPTSSRPPPALGVVAPSRDPLDRVRSLGKGPPVLAFAVVAALLMHGTAAARVALIPVDLLQWTRDIRFRIDERLASIYEIEAPKVEEPPPAPPPPEPEKEAPKEPPPPPVAHEAPKEAPKETAPPPPAAAQAGAVLTQQPDPNEVVDFTGGFVTGSGSTFAGGVTQAGGTSTAPVYNRNAVAGGVPGGTGTGPAPAAGPDRSRKATLAGGSDWQCPFPPEADSEQIDQAKVGVRISVGANGAPSEVVVVKDPGHGFGREAKRCAMRKTYDPALDREGKPMPSQLLLNINFSR